MLKVDKSLKDSLIADSISEWTWEYDLLTGETSTVETLIEFLAYKRHEITEHMDFWFTLIHPDDIKHVSNAFNLVIDGKSDYFVAQYRIKSKNNGYKWMKSKGKALKDKQGRNVYLAGFHIDITSYKQAKESKHKYQTLFDNVNDIIFLGSVSEDGTPGEFIEVNNVATKLLGYSKDELLNISYSELYADKDNLQTYKRFLKNALKSVKEDKHDNCYTFEAILLRKNKTILPVEINTHVFNLNGRFVRLSVMRDISERIKAAEEVMEITERNKNIVELSPLGVYIYDDGIITYANDPGVKLFGGNSREDVLGRPILDFVAPSHKQLVAGRQLLINNGYTVNPMEINFSISNGTSFIGEIYSAPIFSENRILGLCYINDISTQKKIIEENKKLLEQAIEYDRLKTEFFSNISHELRTPLNILLSCIQLLNSIYNNSKENPKDFTTAFEKYIGTMKQNSYRLLKLINNIIDLTRLDSGFLQMNFDNHNIVEVVENITQSVTNYTESKGINLIFDTDVEEKIIGCDDDKIERIILNLLSNAIKYTKPGGIIEVNIKDMDNNVLINVKDTGCGIPHSKLDVIFERFRQVDEVLTRRAEGSGIGLSLVKALVEAHGGTIIVYSTVGLGSEFIISLPSKLVNYTKVHPKSLDTIDNEDVLKKKVERVNIEFSDIYA